MIKNTSLKKLTPSLSPLILCALASCFLFACSHPQAEKLASINIIDRNGLSETITSKDRLDNYQKTDFLSDQPYQKVLRVYQRIKENSDGMKGSLKEGDVRSRVTSYYPNGQVRQYLEAVNSRAFGKYQEWSESGKLKLESTVIGGSADINSAAEQTWVFDGQSKAWDEEGNLIAAILYDKGQLQGISRYYHPNGATWKLMPYEQGKLQGAVEVFLQDGALFLTTNYVNGAKEGPSTRYWAGDKIAHKEQYSKDLLEEGVYYNPAGEVLTEIHKGDGFKAVFGKDSVSEIYQYHNGIPEGKIKEFTPQGHLKKAYHVKNSSKHGEDIEYFTPKFMEASQTPPKNPQPKISIMWNEGIIQGPVKTWYENGTQQSSREMNANKKNGVCTAWYKDGSLMLIEEYGEDRLVKGQYFKKGEKSPTSTVVSERGTVTLFDEDGNFLRKVKYLNGKIVE